MNLDTLRRLLLVFSLAPLAFGLGPLAAAERSSYARESARGIPAAYEVDVVIVGGGTGAVAAAVAAAEEGARVFLAAPYPYLGEDMTATLRLWLQEGEVPEAPLAREIESVLRAGQLPPGEFGLGSLER